MTDKERKELGHLVEQKILDFFGDPDAGLDLKEPFAAELRKRLNQQQKLVPHSEIAAKHGVR